MTDLSLHPRAYIKAFLHSAKYPHETVVGLLVKNNKSEICDAFPLVHHWVDLSFAAEAGVRLALEHLKRTSPDCELAGIYVCNSRIDNLSIPPPMESLAGTLANNHLSNNTPAVVLVLDSSQMTSNPKPFVPYAIASPSEKPVSASINYSYEPAVTLKACMSLITDREGAQAIFDFDDHLEDISAKWLSSPQLVENILSDELGIPKPPRSIQ